MSGRENKTSNTSAKTADASKEKNQVIENFTFFAVGPVHSTNVIFFCQNPGQQNRFYQGVYA
jgi:hypothetical protein